jgi:hypothetical protein
MLVNYINMTLACFGIVKHGIAKGQTQGFIRNFYSSSPVQNAKLIVNNKMFESIYIGPATLEGFDLYKLIFFQGSINLPLGADVSIIVSGAPYDGTVIFYDMF